MKKVLAMLLSVLMVLNLTACFGGEDGPDQKYPVSIEDYPEYLNLESAYPVIKDEYAGTIKLRVAIATTATGGEIVAVEKTPEDALLAMLEGADIDFCEIITLFVGKGVSDERRATLTERLKNLYEDFEINVYEGGQDVYDYLVAVE